jgi:type II restriction/modification system DNA methylase subunit YeeA
MAKWRERLLRFRVLDPACGSGNFLYLSLLALKGIEHRANLEAEQLGLPREFPRVGPECVLGIELNPYAAELARVSVWIGEIQWMRRNGFAATTNPVLRSLDTIENRDAVLDEATGQRAKWPQADAVVGNPPFLGNKKMIRELGEPYTAALRKAWPQVPGGADLVCYWFAGAWDRMTAGELTRAGLVATNSIRSGANRDVLKPIVEHGRIYEAWSDEPWTVDGAAVRVSMVCFEYKSGNEGLLDGIVVQEIKSDLTASANGIDLTKAAPLPTNVGAYIGDQKTGAFDIRGDDARRMLLLPKNPHGRPNAEVVVPWLTGKDVTGRPLDKWIIDFGVDMPLADAALYEAPFAHLREHVMATREGKREERTGERWWLHQRPRPAMRRALTALNRFIVTPRVAKHRLFKWASKGTLPDTRFVVVARSDDTAFGILSSNFHMIWSLATCSWHGVGNDPTYNAQSCFETFPFPEGLTPNIPAPTYADDPRAIAIAKAAARLDELRENWLNPADLVRREPEVVPGYPDRVLPVSEAAAKDLAKRTLTNLYNARPAWLDHAHRALDEAVADAYGWGDDYRAGLLTDDEILARLFRLNQDRRQPPRA